MGWVTVSFTHVAGAGAWQRAVVFLPVVRRGPTCARVGCRWTAWFVVHHVPVCSSACAERIAVEPWEGMEPVVRAVRWGAWTLVVASRGRRHDRLAAYWWVGDGVRGGRRVLARGVRVDVVTDAGLWAVVRRLVELGASELRPMLVAAWPAKAGRVERAPWLDVELPQEPLTLARAMVRAARVHVRQAERRRVVRACYRQRGVSHPRTGVASRVA